MNNDIYTRYLSDPKKAPYFGQALLLDVILPDILGDDASNIVYWEGKQLARRFVIGTPDDLIIFFNQAGFGDLALVSQSEKEWRFTLTGRPILSRLENSNDAPFMLEAGFLAETIQQITGALAETEVTSVHQRKGVTFTVHADPKDMVADPEENRPMTVIKPTQPTDDKASK